MCASHTAEVFFNQGIYMIQATVIVDSISQHTNQRITTFELIYPRFIHSELMTHRQFSRNAASSRAIPINKMIDLVKEQPAIPIHWGKNQSGMQAKEELDYNKTTEAIDTWLWACGNAIISANMLNELGLHKQVVNRLLEPFQCIKVLVTATSFDNFFNLRLHSDAQPEIQELAKLMYQAMQDSKPMELSYDEWHLPYIERDRDTDGKLVYYIFDDNDNPIALELEEAQKISCSCAAQVSYRNNDTSIQKAEAIYDKLVNSNPIHASPFEHCATPIDPDNYEAKGITHMYKDGTLASGNFINWIQYRQLIPNHDCKEYMCNIQEV